MNASDLSAHRVTGHRQFLHEICGASGSSTAVERDVGSSWELGAVQRLREPCTGPGCGDAHPPLINLEVSDDQTGHDSPIEMTTGEARTQAAHLIALADHVDLSGRFR